MNVESSMVARKIRAFPVTTTAVSLETVDCSFCGSPDYLPYDSVDEWRIVKCNRCGFCFTNPRPSAEDAAAFYTMGYFRGEEKERLNLLNDDGSFKVGADLCYDQRILDIESNLDRRGSLLEIGAATGAFLRVMENRGWVVQGIEVSDEAVKLARINDRIDLYCGCLEDFRTDETYDVIGMYQSLEHVPNPAYVIDRAYDLLNPGGLIIIEVPNLNGFDIKRSEERKLQSYDLPLHLNHFTPEFLAGKLKAAGFSIIDLDRYYANFIIRAVERRERSRRPPGSTRQNMATGEDALLSTCHLPMSKKESNWKTHLLKYASRLFPGWRFTIVARK